MNKEIEYDGNHTKGLFGALRENNLLPISTNIIYKNSSLLEDAGDRDPKYPFGIDNPNFTKAWHSKYDEENAWLEVKFPGFYFHLKSYSLKGLSSNHFQSWNLTAYRTNGEEVTLSSIVNASSEFDVNGFVHYDVDNPEFGYYNKFRITMIGERTGESNKDHLQTFEIFLMEFFGTISFRYQQRISCVFKNHYLSYYSLIFLTIRK